MSNKLISAEEAAHHIYHSSDTPTGINIDSDKLLKEKQDAFIAGAQWKEQQMQEESAPTKCPTCGTPCTTTWSGLELVNSTGDETLATKHYHPLPSFEEIEYERLKEANGELLKALNVAKQMKTAQELSDYIKKNPPAHEHQMAAMQLAYEHTFWKGYNPEVMDEMYKILEDLAKNKVIMGVLNQYNVSSILEQAKLK